MPSGVYKHNLLTEEHKKKISLGNKGKYVSNETKYKMKLAQLGKKRSQETKEKLRLISKGNKNMLGKHHSEKTKQILREKNSGKNASRFGVNVSKETREKIRLKRLGFKFSEEAKKKMSLSHIGQRKGKLCHLWKGGITPIILQIRHSSKYNEWRTQVFIRDNFTCQDCRVKGGEIEAHHIKRFSELMQEAIKYLPLLDIFEACMLYSPLWDIDNGKTLCTECHSKYPTRIK